MSMVRHPSTLLGGGSGVPMGQGWGREVKVLFVSHQNTTFRYSITPQPVRQHHTAHRAQLVTWALGYLGMCPRNIPDQLDGRGKCSCAPATAACPKWPRLSKTSHRERVS